MPRIQIISESDEKVLDEHVNGLLLADEHASLQMLERLEWAVGDAEGLHARRSRRQGRVATTQGYLDVIG